jgi:protein ImuB
MDRPACIDVPALPLQILARRHPSWSGFPLAVVDRDTPQGVILWLDERARAKRLRAGMRYAEALSVAPDLRTDVVSPDAIASATTAIARRLQDFSPIVETAPDSPGVFWSSAAGLSLLYPTLHDWARAVRAGLGEIGFHANVVVGFSHFGTYALARTQSGLRVVESSVEEERASRAVPLERLEFDPSLLATLGKLGVRTVGTFLRLPATGLLERFGERAHRLHRLASGMLRPTLDPAPVEHVEQAKLLLDEPVADSMHLVFLVKGLLEPILERSATAQAAITCLHLRFVLDRRESVIETVRPAEPTLDGAILLELVQLRLHASRLPAGVTELELRVETVRATRAQLDLFAASRRRDLDAGARALARLRAELGESAVMRARLREGHLPEAGFTWEPADRLHAPQARKVRMRTLVRRMQARPLSLPPRPASERNDAWLDRGTSDDYGRIVRFVGPYLVSGGWWRTPIHREYHFIETARGDLLWAYYDRRRRRWFLQGAVE